jgi:Uma2 family endonuclease
MVMPLRLPTYTVEQVRALPPDGNRYELVEGILLVTPQPASDHQVVVIRLATALEHYLRPAGLAWVVSPGEIEVAPRHHLEPDVLVVPASYPIGTGWTGISDWWLAIEVFSPSSRYYDRDYKRESYLHLGVKEVWLVDYDRREIEISTAGARRMLTQRNALVWQPGGMPAPLKMDLGELFRGVPSSPAP